MTARCKACDKCGLDLLCLCFQLLYARPRLCQLAFQFKAALNGEIRCIQLAGESDGDQFCSLRISAQIADMGQLQQVVFKLLEFLWSHGLSVAVKDDDVIARGKMSVNWRNLR